MSEVYRRVNGMKLEKFIALHEDAQKGIEEANAKRAAIARGVLASHAYAGHSRIEIEHGRVDIYTVLNDERGQAAANVIEFGRPGGRRDKNGKVTTPMPAVKPLRTAFPEIDRWS